LLKLQHKSYRRLLAELIVSKLVYFAYILLIPILVLPVSWWWVLIMFLIMHFLFPNICHVHYRKIAPIVRETALEFGIPYHVQPNFVRVVLNHGEMLKRLGSSDQPAIIPERHQ